MYPDTNQSMLVLVPHSEHKARHKNQSFKAAEKLTCQMVRKDVMSKGMGILVRGKILQVSTGWTNKKRFTPMFVCFYQFSFRALS